MSEITREINKITGTIIGISGKLIIYALVVLLLVEGVSKGYEFGHEVFSPTPMSGAPGRDVTVTIKAGASATEVADDFYRLGLINNKYTLIVQNYFYQYRLNSGTYVFDTSMTSKQMMNIINEQKEEEETAGAEVSPAPAAEEASGLVPEVIHEAGP